VTNAFDDKTYDVVEGVLRKYRDLEEKEMTQDFSLEMRCVFHIAYSAKGSISKMQIP